MHTGLVQPLGTWATDTVRTNRRSGSSAAPGHVGDGHRKNEQGFWFKCSPWARGRRTTYPPRTGGIGVQPLGTWRREARSAHSVGAYVQPLGTWATDDLRH